jgi:hypothetical protein
MIMNYLQIATLTYERQATFLAEAEQRRLANIVAPPQVHPCLVWIGQQLIRWGQQLLRAKETPVGPFTPETVAH